MSRIIIIGLDGATWNIIDPLIMSGELPNLSRLRQSGTSGILRTTQIPVSPSAWTSFMTGRRPENHGIFDFSKRKAGSYDTVPNSTKDRIGKTFWKVMGDSGKEVCVINVPMTYPVESVNGIMISGFPTPEELNDFTYPKELLDELKGEFGPDLRLQPIIGQHDEERFLDEMDLITENTYKVSRYLMDKKNWDLFMTVFVGPDALSHAYWKYMDKSHVLYNEKAPQKFKNAIENCYRAVDKRIGDLLKSVNEKTAVFVVSDHGFGPLHFGFNLNTWLMKKRYLSLRRGLGTSFRKMTFKMRFSSYNILKILKKLGIIGLAQNEAYSDGGSILTRIYRTMVLSEKDIDWSKTRAYEMGNIGQIYLNLVGREPSGIIRDDKERSIVVAKIMNDLKEIEHDYCDGPVFDTILEKKEAFPSSTPLDDAPDIIFYRHDIKYSVNRFFEFGSKDIFTKTPVWSGTHTPDGIFICSYPGYIMEDQIRKDTSIIDIAPTILSLFGIPISNDTDGAPLKDIFIKYPDIDRIDIEKQKLKKIIGAGNGGRFG